ncbi:FAD-dependent monooxygenase [Sphingobium boeckii]|uniref:2-polyprenyl-6-methoxyphenol hydroxylase-like FAD-dependent oxidoreductase n=1 Tax=Sphingobium boeckii TaxID=1082345 RepID=A0A7W9AFX2_9SPHN|nr:2-polyprenyl-6-methoxyphenol hydroxylase-like FAD-dependent oxidoreductase [Sphingobium boeckii]
MPSPVSRECEVLIIGAGPAGLAAAIELGLRGIRVLVVERNARAGVAPRAKTTNVRTRTHLRRWGIADRLAEESPFGIDYPNDMIFLTRIGDGGQVLARFDNAFNAAPARSDLYPEHAQWIPQYTLEKVLLEKARSLPSVEIRFDTQFLSASQDEDAVHAQIESQGEKSDIVSRYLIGADGARSAVRDLIGAKMEGRHGLSRSYNIIFRAPGLAQAHGFGPASVYWQIGKAGFSALGPMDRDDIWFFGPAIGMEATLTHEQAAAMIRDRTGIDLEYEILSADAWFASELLADHYSDRRIILAGDACHLHPPFGGYGMNMGIGDGVDLGWKIAGTLQGWGGPALVASYEAERRPVHRAVITEAVANLGVAASSLPPEIEDDSPLGAGIRAKVGGMIQATKGREFHTLGTVLGLGYEDSPVICGEAGPPPEHQTQVYTPTARPGYLAPHVWLDDGRSLYDCFGLGFTLIADVAADPADVKSAVADARALGVPLDVVRPDGVDIAGLFEAKLVLIRPDQHVAWRGERWGDALRVATGLGVSETLA